MALNFFTNVKEKQKLANIPVTEYLKATPTNGEGQQGIIDVYNNFDWRISGNISEVPYITLTEYVLDFGKLVQNVAQAVEGVSSQAGFTGAEVTAALQGKSGSGGEAPDPYKAMYSGTKTGFIYNLPYLKTTGSSIRGRVQNSWSSDSTAGSLILKAIDHYGKGAGEFISPGFGSEPIKKFGNTAERSIEINFPLYNTRTFQAANDHFSFVSLFTIQNLKTRTSLLTHIPPKIYEVHSDGMGGIYMPAAYVSSFDVQNIGTLRSMNDFGSVGGSEEDKLFSNGKRWIPEAYKVSITLTELIPQSSNIVFSELGEKRVSAISTAASQKITF